MAATARSPSLVHNKADIEDFHLDTVSDHNSGVDDKEMIEMVQSTSRNTMDESLFDESVDQEKMAENEDFTKDLLSQMKGVK